MLLIWPLGKNFSEILIGTFSFKNLHLKTSSAKWHLFCLGLNELMIAFNDIFTRRWESLCPNDPEMQALRFCKSVLVLFETLALNGLQNIIRLCDGIKSFKSSSSLHLCMSLRDNRYAYTMDVIYAWLLWNCNVKLVSLLLIIVNHQKHQNVNQNSNWQQTPHTSPSRTSYGVPIVSIWEKIDHVITAPHCSWFARLYVLTFTESLEALVATCC